MSRHRAPSGSLLANGKAQWYGAIAVHFVAFAIVLFPSTLTSNEETYFGFALQFVAPQQFSPFSAFFEQSKHLFAFNTLAGSLIAGFGYGSAQVLLRLLQAALYAVGFSLLARSLRLSLLGSLVGLAAFLYVQFRLPGGSWLFYSVESKTLAYGLVFLGLAAALEGRRRTLLASAILATYFHFQVGGFWAAFCFALFALLHQAPRRALGMAAIYGLAIAPLVGIIAYQQLVTLGETAGSDPSASYIYSMIRVPHHVAPFAEGQLKNWATQAVKFALVLAAVCLLARRSRSPERHEVKTLARMLELVGAFLALALVISWFDRHTGNFGKFFLFRPVAMTALLCLLIAVSLLTESRRVRALMGGRMRKGVWLAVAVLAFAVIVREAPHPFVLEPSYPYGGLVSTVHRETAPGDLVVVEEVGDSEPSLPRRLERPTLVHWTFIPTNPAGIQKWYDRILWRRRLFETGCAPEVLRRFPVRYIALLRRESRATMQRCGEVVWSSDGQTLIKVRPPPS